ncbi:di-glucose binding protein with Kinesin motor domain-containing protein [Wolffia australiana]
MEEVRPNDDEMFESMLCVPESKLFTTGINGVTFEDVVIFVNAGGGKIEDQDSSTKIEGDTHFEGGDAIKTNADILDTGNLPSALYQSARYGTVISYAFCDLPPGNYFVDLHFAEIVYTNGPKGMRVFDVFIQRQKVLSEVDIYALVGANKPLVILDVGVNVEECGQILVKFEGVRGSPSISGICIREAKKTIAPTRTFLKSGSHLCGKCASETERSPLQDRVVLRYERKIQDLESLCKHKTDECYEAWMSLTDANAQLERLRMELDTKLFHSDSLDQDIRIQAEKLESVSARYEGDKRRWAAALRGLQEKVELMKTEQAQLSREAHECASGVPELSKMIAGVQALVTQCEDLKIKYSEELCKRRKLYNQVQEAKGNIRVFCRCRPLTKEEISAGYSTALDFEGAKDGDLGLSSSSSSRKMFKFDRVFTPKDDQSAVYADASPLVVSVLDGFNVCIFAYGQTGTGKTFTMEGPEQSRGVNYRTLEELFKIARDKREAFSYDVTVSVLEVYNEQIRDLLASSSTSSKKLKVRQASEVPGIVEAKVESVEEAWDVLRAGSSARVVGSNNVNEHSSRSHCMLGVRVKAKNLVNRECTNSKLWLVDLAGSERLAKTDAQGERLKEAQSINKSLSALGDVISALANKSSHIPYRNSKLTHLLQDSLGGDSKVLMFVQVSPSENDYSETLSSLNFATRVRGVELGPAKRQVDNGELQKTKQLLDKVKQECRLKEETLRRMEESYQSLEGKLRNKDQLCRSLQEKLKDLEGQLQAKADLRSSSDRQQLLQVSEALKAKEEACSTLQQNVKEIENRLKEQQQSAMYTVKDLECRLNERESREYLLEQKIKALQWKLEEVSRRPMITTQRGEVEVEVEEGAYGRILRASTIENQGGAAQTESELLKGVEPLQHVKRRRERETGNEGFNGNEIKERRRKSLAPRPSFGRVTRAATTATLPTRGAAAAPLKLPARGQDKERATKIWSR